MNVHLLTDLGFRPSLQNDHLMGMKVIDPNSGIKSSQILSKLLTKDISQPHYSKNST